MSAVSIPDYNVHLTDCLPGWNENVALKESKAFYASSGIFCHKYWLFNLSAYVFDKEFQWLASSRHY
jgi:hypothetical protein